MRIFIDLDDTIFDFQTPYREGTVLGIRYPQAHHGFFANLNPLPGAIEAVSQLALRHDVWFATRPSVMNPMSYTEKRLSIENHFGLEACERLILIPDKSLLIGDCLIDDGDIHGQPEFQGRWIQFGSPAFKGWEKILTMLD
ncbi:MAG: hypothetical protein AAF226_01610 [Verrucomicrobiota bacterium]